MKRKNIIKTLASFSAAVLFGLSLNTTSNVAHADTESTSQFTVTKNNGKVTLKVSPITFDVTVKNSNPLIGEVPVKSEKGTQIKTEQSTYQAGDVLKVYFYLEFKNDSGNTVKGYVIAPQSDENQDNYHLIFADDVTTSTVVPSQEDYAKQMQDKLANAKSEYDENAKKEAEEQAKKQAADLKKRFLYYTVKRKSSKKTKYYYTGYGKVIQTKKSKKIKVTFKKNKYKIKAKTIKVDQITKVGKTTYYHVKGKSSNFWVNSSDFGALKPVFRKK